MENEIPSSLGNKKVKQKKELFYSFIKENKHRSFFVCSHDNPDPDSLSSAFGMVHILSFLGVESIEIYYCGEISHPQNRAMQNILSLPVKRWNKIAESSLTEDDKPVVVFVDCAGKQKNMSINADPDIAIDHHKTSPTNKNAIFIHDDVGACATLITDLILSVPPSENGDQKLFCFDPDSDGMKEIATALAIGIKTDTLDFRSETTTDDDFRAYKLLSKYVSDDKFNKIINYELPPYLFESEQIAWKNKNLMAPNLITCLGFIDESKSDCIPYIADKMMRLQGIQTVMVYAIVGNSIRVSTRTVSASLDAQNLLNEVCGEGNGGAKSGIGGAYIPLNIFGSEEMDDTDRQRLLELTKSCLEKRFEKATQK